MLTFEPFRIWFIKNHPTNSKVDFRNETGLANSSAAKVWKDRFPVRSDLIDRICETYNLDIQQVVQYRPKND